MRADCGWLPQQSIFGLQPWVPQQSLSSGTFRLLEIQQLFHETLEVEEVVSQNTCFYVTQLAQSSQIEGPQVGARPSQGSLWAYFPREPLQKLEIP